MSQGCLYTQTTCDLLPIYVTYSTDGRATTPITVDAATGREGRTYGLLRNPGPRRGPSATEISRRGFRHSQGRGHRIAVNRTRALAWRFTIFR
jgi:hypothetical protein